MRVPSELTHDELLNIVGSIQTFLYLDTDEQGREFWNPDNPISGADLLDHVAFVLDDYGLAPEKRQPAEGMEIPDDKIE